MNVNLGEVDPATDHAVRVMVRSDEFRVLIRSFRLQVEEALVKTMDNVDPDVFMAGRRELPNASIGQAEKAMRLKIVVDELERLLAPDDVKVYGSININL